MIRFICNNSFLIKKTGLFMKSNNFVLLLLFFVPFLIASEIKTVIASGYGSDLEKAKNTALRNSLEQVIGVYLKSNTYLKNFATIEDNIYSSTEGYIDSYEILRTDLDGTTGGRIVTVQANIIITNLTEELEKLGILAQKMDFPRIIVIENNSKKNTTDSYLKKKCYNGIVQILTENNFFIIDKTTTEDFNQEQKDIAFSELNNKIAEYGLKINADYIIRYDLRTSKKSLLTYCDCEVISSSTGKVIISIDQSLPISSTQQNSEIAKIVQARTVGKKIGVSLVGKIQQNWTSRIEKGKLYTLILEGYNHYTKVLDYEEKLQKIKGINAVSEVESGDQKTTILIRYKTSRSELKNKIFKLFKNFDWSTRLIRSENNRMFVKILDD